MKAQSQADWGLGNRAPTTSLSEGMASQYPKLIHNIFSKNIAHVGRPPRLTNKRKANLRIITKHLTGVQRGMVLERADYGQGKDGERIIIALAPSIKGDIFTFSRAVIPFRDPRDYQVILADIDLTQHMMSRLFQRYAGLENRLAGDQLGALARTYFLGDEMLSPGTWEVGTGAGMAVVIVKKLEEGCLPSWAVVTWVDKARLHDGQPFEAGVCRRIGG